MEILIPKPHDPTFSALSAVGGHAQWPPLLMACARVSLVKGVCRNIKLGITGTQKVPQRLHHSEALLEDKRLTKTNIEMVANDVSDRYQPISDSLASEEYRREIGRLAVKKALQKCLETAETTL